MKQIYEDLSDDTDFDIIDLDDVPDRDTVKRRNTKATGDVNKTSNSDHLPPNILQKIHKRSGQKKPGNVLPETLETAVQKLPGKSVPLHPLRSSPLR